MLMFFAGVQIVPAAGFLSLDADARYVNTDFSTDDFALKTLGVVARQVIADETADRWVLYGQLEVVEDFARADFHQLYAQFKGPMGKWNLSAGRLRLPYGLLTGYSTDHVPFAALDHYTIGIESDNGLMASGSIDRVSYAVAVTQGAGIFKGFPEQGLLTGRVAVAFGEAEEITIGLSGAAGRSELLHGAMPVQKRIKLGAIDLLGNVGRTLFRSELTVGNQEENVQIAGFVGADFSALSWLELNSAVSAVREAGVFHHAWGFVGTTFTTPYIMLKGGYKYVYYGTIDHQVTLMVYKQFAFNF
ncbi:MAG: hypothetical protein JXA71_11785 [Chitinispirillaceae bacterium]|nr:hypothetical protein [Chitinispirillaceae bacterium]